MNKRGLVHYVGGKSILIHKILPLMPAHRTYVEVFGGSGCVLFNKPPSCIDVYNDLGDNIYFLFKMMRERGHEVKAFLQKFPYSRKWYFEDVLGAVKGDVGEIKDPVERASVIFCGFEMAFSGCIGGGWSYGTTKQNSAARFKRTVDGLNPFIERLREVQIEHLDFEELIKKYDGPETFFYCDPPYLQDTVRGNVKDYYMEMKEDAHIRMAEILNEIEGKAMVSYYPSENFREWYPADKWIAEEVDVSVLSIKVKKDDGEVRPRATELLLMNYEGQGRANQHSLFSFGDQPAGQSLGLDDLINDGS